MCILSLNNKEVRKELKMTFKGIQIKHNITLIYQGMTLDCILTFKKHYDKTEKKSTMWS